MSEQLAFWLKIMFRKYMFSGSIIKKEKENPDSVLQGSGLLSSSLNSENSLCVKFRFLVVFELL